MPTFATPDPISVSIDLAVGDVRLVASERHDTIVELSAAGPADEAARALERTRVDLVGGRLVVEGPKRRGWGLFGNPPAIAVTIELPAGSQLTGQLAMGGLRTEGRLGPCRFKTSTGDIAVDVVAGPTELMTWTGSIRARVVEGPARLQNGKGDTWVGDAAGDLDLSSAAGDISVERAHTNVTAKTAKGSVRIGEARRGSVVLDTASGGLDVGIAEGTAAWLDVRSLTGHVTSSLEAVEGPGAAERTVEVRARTPHGNIVVHRA